METNTPSALDDDEFAAHVTDVICGAIEVPSTIGPAWLRDVCEHLVMSSRAGALS